MTDPITTIREARTKIVAALNLTPLVPPQADTETMNVVGDAWAALSDIAAALTELEQQLAEAKRLQKIERNNVVLFDKMKAAEADRGRLQGQVSELVRAARSEQVRANRLEDVIRAQWPRKAERIIRAALADEETA